MSIFSRHFLISIEKNTESEAFANVCLYKLLYLFFKRNKLKNIIIYPLVRVFQVQFMYSALILFLFVYDKGRKGI